MENQELGNIDNYIDMIQNAANDKDLLNIILDMVDDKNLDENLVTNIRQLFRNNRYMSLINKKNTIISFIQDNKDKVKTEEHLDKKVYTEAETKNIDKQNNTIAEKINKRVNINILNALKKRIGQQISVGDLNNLLQSIFGQYNKVFILSSDLTNKELDKTQTITIQDDDMEYDIGYDIVDMDIGIVQLVSIDEKGVEV